MGPEAEPQRLVGRGGELVLGVVPGQPAELFVPEPVELVRRDVVLNSGIRRVQWCVG